MDVPATENLRANLAVAIEARDLSKVQVAKAAGTSRMHLDRILKGEVDPSVGLSERLAKSVGFTLGSLIESPEIFSDAVLTNVT
jgi:transcriptional regulator with XRE-family HTH domain